MGIDFQEILGRYIELGGIAENICLREGEHGRGIFPVDPFHYAKILTPKNLLISRDDLCISRDCIYVNSSSGYSWKEKEFIESNYNYAWRDGGNDCAAEFLKYVSTIPESVKNQLLIFGFIDKKLLNSCPDEKGIFKRFIDERVVGFEGKAVLAAVWDFVNHSSFAQPLRVTPYGVETPLIEPSSDEILHKYSAGNSSISIWKKYGFACDCIVAYSIPFQINLDSKVLTIKCSGQHGLGPKEKQGLSLVGKVLSIKSLPVGCISIALPRENLKSILSSYGLSEDIANNLFARICEENLKARCSLIDSLAGPDSGSQAQLYKALLKEVELIKNSSIC